MTHIRFHIIHKDGNREALYFDTRMSCGPDELFGDDWKVESSHRSYTSLPASFPANQIFEKKP